MNSKYKATGFSKLLVFLILFTPIAYLGASYYNGEDGIGNIKKLLQTEKSKADQIKSKKKEIDKYERKIEKLTKDIEALKG